MVTNSTHNFLFLMWPRLLLLSKASNSKTLSIIKVYDRETILLGFEFLIEQIHKYEFRNGWTNSGLFCYVYYKRKRKN